MKRWQAWMIGLAAVSVSACLQTGGRWEKDGASAEDQARDLMGCQDNASAQVNREFNPNFGGLTPASPNPSATGGQWSGMMDQFSAERRQTQLIDRCMTQRGYRFVPFNR